MDIYIVYKTTNLVNGKIYIGVHKQKHGYGPYDFDGYLGSGDGLKSAIKKYGKSNFVRETLYNFDTENDAYEMESKLVTPDFVMEHSNYNNIVGGKGYYSTNPSNTDRNKKLSKSHRELVCLFKAGTDIFIKVKPELVESYIQQGYSTSASGSLSPFFTSGKKTKGSKHYYNPETLERIRINQNDHIPDGFVEGLLDTPENKKLRSERTKKMNTGSKFIHHPETDKQKKVKESDVGYWVSLGWVVGMNKENRHKLKATNEDRVMINDGKKNFKIRKEELDKYLNQGFIRGALPKGGTQIQCNGIVYRCIKVAAMQLGIDSRAITRCLHGGTHPDIWEVFKV